MNKKLQTGINKLKKGGSLVAKGYKKELSKYTNSAKIVRKVINREKISPAEEKELRTLVADLTIRAGITVSIAAYAGITAGVGTSFISGLTKGIIKSGLVNSVKLAEEQLTDEEALKVLSFALASELEKKLNEQRLRRIIREEIKKLKV